MTETIGKREDDAAFAEWLASFYVEQPQYPDELTSERRQGWLMRQAFDAGMERGQEKRGCCEGDGDE